MVARQSDPQHSDQERLLLLLPAMADANASSDAAEVVAAAVTAIGGSDLQDQVAVELLSANGRYWGVCAWTDSQGFRTCLGPHSNRHTGGGLSVPEHRPVADSFHRR
ncbi:hypothetical protein U2F26_10010 [Micromonospora sp. 4G57]|uniref:Uncharacterized protein n=1 Tax=Micromonospora sicca TaxID=2202420 RepID=A0ABU5J6M8_9ACTN|nr:MULTISPECIES: hypothetical protein [unclassified Micromonospora]MDZ5443062.1 hypothetical protein [Micromonospora sp. 4G57]MDZ5488226.1 hypothetical protein [Micromonospora sp. 4G53]